MNVSKIYQLKFLKKKQLNSTVFTFYFARYPSLGGNRFDFISGQYLRFYLPHDNVDSYGSTRFFTISSTPHDKLISITTTVGISSFKKMLFNLKEGDLVQVFGPLGNFQINQFNKEDNLVFLSGGLGITPFYSMINSAYTQKLTMQITLIASFKTKNDFIYFQELNSIMNKTNNIRVIYTTSINQIDWTGENGRINNDLLNKYIKNIKDCIYFITGPTPFVDEVNDLLNINKVKTSKIFTEKFTGY